jgi:hypothetical protein
MFCCSCFSEDSAPNIGPNALPVALMAIPVRHSQKLIELVLRGLPVTANAEVESVAGTGGFHSPPPSVAMAAPNKTKIKTIT